MPELPEVELVARALRERVSGRTVVLAEVNRTRLLPGSTPARFAAAIRGARIETTERRGKNVLVRLDNARVLLVHLRMSGRFLLLGPRDALPAHTHARFALDDGTRLVFSDPRHFAVMKLVPVAQLDALPELRELGPEPLGPEFTPAALGAALSRSRRALKDCLLDQRIVAGLGNIYAAEALFVARVSPFAVARRVSRARVVRLHAAICAVLEESLAHGSTLRVDLDAVDGRYYGGGYAGRWRVYDREGDPCTASCGGRVRRREQTGRSTYYCPRCQR